jgi:cysteine synthase
MEKTTVTLRDIREAAERIRPHIRHTPLLREQSMDKILGCQAYLKPEMLQITGAFKLRGALSRILSLTPDERKRGIIATSSGNHGQACAFAGQMLGIHTTVVIPEDAPAIKIENTKAMGAEVIVWNRKYAERWKKVSEEAALREIREETGLEAEITGSLGWYFHRNFDGWPGLLPISCLAPGRWAASQAAARRAKPGCTRWKHSQRSSQPAGRGAGG